MQKHSVWICAILLLIATIASAADVTGVWTGTASGPDGEYALTFTFKQDGQKLTGAMTGPTDPIAIQEGKVQDGKISYWLQVDMGGNPVKFRFSGTVENDTITLAGTNDAGINLGSALVLKRQKQ
jgi:hypothetical protein